MHELKEMLSTALAQHHRSGLQSQLQIQRYFRTEDKCQARLIAQSSAGSQVVKCVGKQALDAPEASSPE